MEFDEARDLTEDSAAALLNLWQDLGVLPFQWVPDNTRRRMLATLHASGQETLEDTARTYRRDLWRRQPRLVEVWCESDSLAEVLLGVTDEFAVPLLPTRGQASKVFVWQAARACRRARKLVTCLYVGDFDPTGVTIDRSVRERLARYGAPDDMEFRRLAVTPERVRGMSLQGHGLPKEKAGNRTLLARFREVCDEHGIARESVESEAVDPPVMRQMLQDAIGEYIDRQQWELEKRVEQVERRHLSDIAGISPDSEDGD